MQSFTEFQTISTREAETDRFLTLTFDSDEWDIVPQNIAETACIMHLVQYLGNDLIITTTEVVRSGVQKGIIGLEQTRIFKQGLIQQHDNFGRKLQVRFLIVVPGKVFGFQSQHEIVGYPASFVTSLFNARVTTLAEVPGFQLHVDRLEPLHLDTLQDVERFSWIKELNASIEFTKDALNGILVTSRPYTRTSKVQWRETNQDAQQRPGNSAGSCNDELGSTAATTSHREELLMRAEGLGPTQESPSGVKTHEVGSEETDARSKPLSRARICLEDSLSELKILVGQIQAASYVLNDLHLFTSAKQPLGRKMYPSPVTSRWPSTGKERSWLGTNWQHRYLYDSSDQDLMIWPEPPLSSKFEHHDMLYNTSNNVKGMHITCNIGKQKETHISPYLQTLNQDLPTTSLGERCQVQANKNSFYNSTENVLLDAQDYDNEYRYVPDSEPDTNQIVTARKSTQKQMHSSNDPGDIKELPCTETDIQLANPSYFETHKDDEATGSQQLSTKTDMMQNHITSQKSTIMIKPYLSRQASARACRAVAFMAHPDIMNASDDNTLSQMQAQPQAAVIMKRASDDAVSRQSSSAVKSHVASEPRASQTEFPLEPSSGQDGLEQLHDNPILNTRQSQSSARKGNPQALGYAQSRQSGLQSANLPELTADRREEDSESDKNAPALFNRQDFDGVVLAQNDNEDEGMLNVVGDRSSQDSQQADNLTFESHDQMETRKSMPNYTSGIVGVSQQGGGRRQTYQATNQDTAIFQPETRKSFVNRQNKVSSFQQDATFQSEIRKSFANRQSQKAIYLPESKRSTASNRQSQDATFQLESTRKSAVLNRRTQGVISQPEARKSMALNKQNQDVMSQPGMRTNFANRQSSMQQPSALSDFGTEAQSASRPSNINVKPDPYTGELRKSIYQGGSNLQIESSIQEKDTNQLSGEMYDLHQEGDPSDMASSGSSSSQSSTGPSALHESATPELVNRLSRIDLTNLQNMTDQDEAPASVVQLDNRKSRVSSTSTGRAAEQAGTPNQRVAPLATRPSAFESSRQTMRSSPTRGKSQSYINFDDNFRPGDNGRRQSQP